MIPVFSSQNQYIYIYHISQKHVRTSPSSWDSKASPKAPTWLQGTSISAPAPRVPRGSLRRAVPSPADAGTTRLSAATTVGETVGDLETSGNWVITMVSDG